MKKVLFGFVVTSSIILASCSNADDSKLEQTISSLKKENSELVKKNTELEKENTAYSGLMDIVGKDTSDSSSGTDNSSSSSKDNSVKFNVPVEFNSGEKITVQSAEDNSELTLHEPIEGQHAVIVSLVVENTGSTPLSFNSQQFSLYDSNSELATFDASTYSNNVPNSIAAGMKATVVIHFSTKGTGPYMVTFGDAIFKQ